MPHPLEKSKGFLPRPQKISSGLPARRGTRGNPACPVPFNGAQRPPCGAKPAVGRRWPVQGQNRPLKSQQEGTCVIPRHCVEA